MTDDDLDAPAALHSYLSGPMDTRHPEPTRGALRELIGLALKLPDGDRISSRIILDNGGSLGWSQITSIAEQNGISQDRSPPAESVE